MERLDPYPPAPSAFNGESWIDSVPCAGIGRSRKEPNWEWFRAAWSSNYTFSTTLWFVTGPRHRDDLVGLRQKRAGPIVEAKSRQHRYDTARENRGTELTKGSAHATASGTSHRQEAARHR